LTWQNLFSPTRKSLICQICSEQLEKVGEDLCNYCSRTYTDFECPDCKQWKWHYNKKDPLEKNISVFRYNDFMKEVITKWKYRGDYQLGYIFQSIFNQIFLEKFAHLHHPYEIVSIPLS